MKLYDILKEGREDFISDREKQAYKLRQSGMYFKDIARELGVSTGRAQQMIVSYERQMSRRSELYDILPPGLVNKLRDIWGNIDTIDELRDLANSNELHLIPNIGPKSIALITQWIADNPSVRTGVPREDRVPLAT